MYHFVQVIAPYFLQDDVHLANGAIPRNTVYMIRQTNFPKNALLARFDPAEGHYTDCFLADVPGEVSLARFIEAFYTAPLFRCERVILKFIARRPSTDAEARSVAQGNSDAFSAWSVEERTDTQLLMRDMHDETSSWFTRSWFMIEHIGDNTRLLFGSAVSPRDGTLSLGLRAFLPIHRLYSRLLLQGAVNRLTAADPRDV